MKKFLLSILCLCLMAFFSDMSYARGGKHSGKRAATTSTKKSSSNGKRAASTGRKSTATAKSGSNGRRAAETGRRKNVRNSNSTPRNLRQSLGNIDEDYGEEDDEDDEDYGEEDDEDEEEGKGGTVSVVKSSRRRSTSQSVFSIGDIEEAIVRHLGGKKTSSNKYNEGNVVKILTAFADNAEVKKALKEYSDREIDKAINNNEVLSKAEFKSIMDNIFQIFTEPDINVALKGHPFIYGYEDKITGLVRILKMYKQIGKEMVDNPTKYKGLNTDEAYNKIRLSIWHKLNGDDFED